MYDVALFVGHGVSIDGSWDCGCAYWDGKKTYKEADLMMPIVKWAVRYLRLNGLKVFTDAFTGNNINMIKQVEKANKLGAKLSIAVHCDYDKAPSGVQALYVSGNGLKLGNAITKAVKKELGIPVKPAAERGDLYELTATNMPAVILETGSIKADIEVLRDKPKAYGKAIAKGICDYLGVKFVTSIYYTASTNMTARAGVKLTSKKVGKYKKGDVFKVYYFNSTGKRAKTSKGWVTIKYARKGM